MEELILMTWEAEAWKPVDLQAGKPGNDTCISLLCVSILFSGSPKEKMK